MSSEPKVNAWRICLGAQIRIRGFLYPRESCNLIKDESGTCFVFQFTVRDFDGVQETGSFAVLGATIEDGIISEQRLRAALWHTLGQIRGMV